VWKLYCGGISMKRKTIAIIVLSSLVLATGIQYLIKASWRQYPIMVVIITAGIIMFVQSGNDSNWLIEKSILKFFRGNKNA